MPAVFNEHQLAPFIFQSDICIVAAAELNTAKKKEANNPGVSQFFLAGYATPKLPKFPLNRP